MLLHKKRVQQNSIFAKIQESHENGICNMDGIISYKKRS